MGEEPAVKVTQAGSRGRTSWPCTVSAGGHEMPAAWGCNHRWGHLDLLLSWIWVVRKKQVARIAAVNLCSLAEKNGASVSWDELSRRHHEHFGPCQSWAKVVLVKRDLGYYAESVSVLTWSCLHIPTHLCFIFLDWDSTVRFIVEDQPNRRRNLGNLFLWLRQHLLV